MDEKQIKEALESEAGQKAIADAVQAANKALEAKRDELLGSLRKEKDAKKELESRLEALESKTQEAEEKAAAQSGDLEKLKEQMEARHKKELEAAQATAKTLQEQLNTHVIGEGLTKALVQAKISVPLMDAAKALINSTIKSEVGEQDGKPVAIFDGKDVNTFVAEWAQSEQGKHFVSASNNTGGGSNGANGSSNASNSKSKTMSRAEFDQLDMGARAEAMKEGVTLTQ